MSYLCKRMFTNLQTKMDKNKSTSLRGRLLAMEVRDTIVVPLALYKSETVRNYASYLGRDYGRKYATKFDHCAQAHIITREY